MPIVQNATKKCFPFGASGTGNPVAANQVYKGKVNRGGRVNVRFAARDKDLTVTVQVSADDTTYAALTAPNNQTVITNAVVKARAIRDFPINLRAGQDLFFRILATGNGSGEVTLEPVKEDAFDDMVF